MRATGALRISKLLRSLIETISIDPVSDHTMTTLVTETRRVGRSFMAYEFARYLKIRTAHGATWSPDGRRIAFLTDITGVRIFR